MKPGLQPAESAAVIHVVAGVICDPGGRVLLARRTRGRDLAGLWEFPGGKLEAGEDPAQALRRELHEELGIQIDPPSALIAVPHRYPHKRILLDVYRVGSYQGTPRGREQQALAWAPLARLARYPMPAADRPVVAALQQPEFIAITPETPIEPDVLAAGILRLAMAGMRRILLRRPHDPPAEMRALASRLLPELRGMHAELLLHADVEGAKALGCGLHLPARMAAAWKGRASSNPCPLTVACHDLEELQVAERLGAHAALLGAVAATATHPQCAPLGWEEFGKLREQTALPIYALGGLGVDDLGIARRHGAQGVAGIRGFWM